MEKINSDLSQEQNQFENLNEELTYWEKQLGEDEKNELQGNANIFLDKIIQHVECKSLVSDEKGENSKYLSTYLYHVVKIKKKDVLIAMKSSAMPLKKKLRLYMLLVEKNDRKFLDMYTLMDKYNYEVYIDGNPTPEIINFVDHNQYIEFFNGLPDEERTLRNLLLIPNFIIFWNMNLDSHEEAKEDYDKIIHALFGQIKFDGNIQSNKEKYKQTIKNMNLICVKSINGSYKSYIFEWLATELKFKDYDNNDISVDQTFSDFADMLFAEKLIDQNTCNRLKSGPNFLLLHLSAIWEYVKFFFRKNLFGGIGIYESYDYDSKILIEKINHFGNIFAPGYFNCKKDDYLQALRHADYSMRINWFEALYYQNPYFIANPVSVLGQMLINNGLKKARETESPNFNKEEVVKENDNKEEKPKEEIKTGEEIKITKITK